MKLQLRPWSLSTSDSVFPGKENYSLTGYQQRLYLHSMPVSCSLRRGKLTFVNCHIGPFAIARRSQLQTFKKKDLPRTAAQVFGVYFSRFPRRPICDCDG